MLLQQRLQFSTPGRGTLEITDAVQKLVRESGVERGLCHLFCHHTSASLTLTENADPAVRRDLERFMERLVPDGDPLFEHLQEGVDDMAAHLRSVLTSSELTLPVTARRCALGTWQGIFLWEHRHAPHRRSVTVSVSGETDQAAL